MTRLKWSRSSKITTPDDLAAKASVSERISSRRLARPVVGSVLALRRARALGFFIGVEGETEVLRPAPTKQDDGDVEQERDLEAAGRIREVTAPDRNRQDLAPEPDEQQDRRDRRARRDQVAARDADSLVLCSRTRLVHFLIGTGPVIADRSEYYPTLASRRYRGARR